MPAPVPAAAALRSMHAASRSAPAALLESLLQQPEASIVLVAPHPDDETLAAGGLLQRARAAGARVSVLLLTDGDNNPWPQRWLQRRWRIDATARAAWGRRRRAEALTALIRLGLDPGDLYAFGWPDQGLTARIQRHLPDTLERLRGLLGVLRPTLVVAPALADRHPDHSAARVLVELALAASALPRPPLWGFAVHGAAPAAQPLVLATHERAAKLRALEAHTSQLALAGGRWRRRVHAGEFYQIQPPPPLQGDSAAGIALPWHPVLPGPAACALLVVAGAQCWQLPWQDGVQSGPLRLRLRPQPSLEWSAPPPGPLFVKLHSRRRSMWIFDRWGWRQVAAAP